METLRLAIKAQKENIKIYNEIIVDLERDKLFFEEKYGKYFDRDDLVAVVRGGINDMDKRIDKMNENITETQRLIKKLEINLLTHKILYKLRWTYDKYGEKVEKIIECFLEKGKTLNQIETTFNKIGGEDGGTKK